MRSELQTAFTIETPLFAFERVFRHTGTIRKVCVFHNGSGEPLRLRVRFGFVEHSWIQLFSEAADAGVGRDPAPDLLVIGPGETRVHVLMNTDSSNFPYDRFRGRVWFEEPQQAGSPAAGAAGAAPDADDRGESVGRPADQNARFFEINFELIEELRDFQGYAAIDLGTSNSMIALYHLQRDAVTGAPWSPVLEQGEAEVPSAVFIKDLAQFKKLADGSCSVGRAAIDEYRASTGHDPRSLQLGVKRLCGVEKVLAADAQGAGGYVSPGDVLYMLGRFVRERAQNHDDVRARLKKLFVTFPPTWEYRQIEQWKQVFRRLGFTDADLDLSVDEASAAGLFYIHQWTKDADSRNRLLQDLLPSWQAVTEDGQRKGDQYLLNLLSFDFGGGTIDLAFIRVELCLLEDIIRMRLALDGSDSLAYGGDQVTLATFRILKRRIAMALTDPARLGGRGEAAADASAAAAAAEDHSVESGLFLLPTRVPQRRTRVLGSAERGSSIIHERWAELEQRIATERLPQELEDAVEAVFPTRFWRSPEEPISPAQKRNFGWLWEQAESLKQQIFRQASRQMKGISLAAEADDVRGGILLRDVPPEILGRQLRGSDWDGARAWVSSQEINRAIAGPLEKAVWRARQLCSDQRVDRVVLTGQSSWIPLVRRLFMRPRSEGGFGLPPSKIEFDEENAKAAVSKGACLLRVMRDTLVGFDVDVSDFKANLLADIFYTNPVGGRRTLFTAGGIDDLRFVEESPDPPGFAQHLAIFYGSAENLLGQFDFTSAGDPLPDFDDDARATADALALAGGFPEHAELTRQRKQNRAAAARTVGAMLDWPERTIVAWMEHTAAAGSAERPLYRYYLTRNRNLLAVRDLGRAGGKRLFALQVDECLHSYVSPRESPFSGIH